MLYSDEQIEAAREVSILDYLRANHLEIRQIGNQIKVESINGLSVTTDGRKWYDFYSQHGGGIIQFVQWFKGIQWKDAVGELLAEVPVQTMASFCNQRKKTEIPRKKSELSLPPKGESYRHIFAYLVKTRKIDPKIVATFVDRHLLYEDDHRNCVFLCKNKSGKDVGAFKRSSQDYKIFKGMAPGSSENDGFSLLGSGETMRIFESPIDMMSYLTIQEKNGAFDRNIYTDHFLALNGLKHQPLVTYLQEYPKIKSIIYSVDNDPVSITLGRSPGHHFIEQNMELLAKLMPERFFRFNEVLSKEKDWNDDLKKLCNSKKTQIGKGTAFVER